jgi:outer membrane lipoprotein SlyB
MTYMRPNSIAAVLITFAVSCPVHAAIFGADGTASVVPKNETRILKKVSKGTVVMVADVKIDESDATKVGIATTGALTGAVLGGDRKAAQSAIVGGVVGAATALAMGMQKAQDLIIAVEPNGELVNVTQAVDDKLPGFADGEKVLLITAGEKARVIRDRIGLPPDAPRLPPVSDAAIQPTGK